jgi:5-methylcytosine-specific restriction endonuclease McrA
MTLNLPSLSDAVQHRRPNAKPAPRVVERRAKVNAAKREERQVKAAVRLRDGGRCRVCGKPGESVHEIDPKGMGGSRTAVRLDNCITVCGDGVRGCHGRLQRCEIRFKGKA